MCDLVYLCFCSTHSAFEQLGPARAPGSAFDSHLLHKIHATLRLGGVFAQGVETALACIIQGHAAHATEAGMRHLFQPLELEFRESVLETKQAFDRLSTLVDYLYKRMAQPNAAGGIPDEIHALMETPFAPESTVLTGEYYMRDSDTSSSVNPQDRTTTDRDTTVSTFGQASRQFFVKYDQVCKQLQPKYFNGAADIAPNVELQAFNAMVFCQFKLLSLVGRLIYFTQELIVFSFHASEE